MQKAVKVFILLLVVLSCKSGGPDPVEQARSIEELSERIQFLEKSIHSKDNDGQFAELSYMLAQAYGKFEDYEKLDKLVDRIVERGPGKGRALNLIAWTLAEAGVHMDDAVKASETAIRWTRNEKPENRPKNLSLNAWEQRRKWRLSAYLDTYGVVLYKLKLFGRADVALDEAVQLDNENYVALTHLSEVKISLSKYDEALKLTVKAILLGAGEDADSLAKKAYCNWLNTTSGFEDYLAASLEELESAERKAMVQNKLNIPAPDFTLKDTEGNNVSLSDFPGQIIFIDFWSTKCPPCLEELPIFQETYEKYCDEGVVFLAINTEKETENVVPFLKKNDYAFTVLYDKKIKSAYDVAGIPTIFILDGEGIIRYKHVGYRPDAGEIWEEQIAELKKQL